MATAAEYRVYAQEAVDSARTSTSEDVRRQFLDIAKLWLTAAAKLDGSEVNGEFLEMLHATPRHGGVMHS
jgi:hypothetical protein